MRKTGNDTYDSFTGNFVSGETYKFTVWLRTEFENGYWFKTDENGENIANVTVNGLPCDICDTGLVDYVRGLSCEYYVSNNLISRIDVDGVSYHVAGMFPDYDAGLKTMGCDIVSLYWVDETQRDELIADVTETTAKIKSLKSGTKYKFKVRAYVKDDGTIYGSYSSVFETATKTKTPEITSVKSSSKGKATVKWSNVSGESKYQLYYATSKNGTYKRYDTYAANDTDATVKNLTSGKTYYFKVRTYKNTDSGKVYSSYSAVKSVKVK